MTMQDPVSDLLTRIRNAQSMRKRSVVLPASTEKAAIAQVLFEEGYVNGVEWLGDAPKRSLEITLKYHEGRPVIAMIDRVSSPGLRVYKGAGDLPVVMGGLGIAVISTSQGIMSSRVAKTKGLGGEVICIVY